MTVKKAIRWALWFSWHPLQVVDFLYCVTCSKRAQLSFAINALWHGWTLRQVIEQHRMIKAQSETQGRLDKAHKAADDWAEFMRLITPDMAAEPMTPAVEAYLRAEVAKKGPRQFAAEMVAANKEVRELLALRAEGQAMVDELMTKDPGFAAAVKHSRECRRRLVQMDLWRRAKVEIPSPEKEKTCRPLTNC